MSPNDELARAKDEIARLRGAIGYAKEHIEELREAFRSGALESHDGKNGQRSNHNHNVSVILWKALAASPDEWLAKHDAPFREALAVCYQMAGAYNAPVWLLDNLSALVRGEKAPHEWQAVDYPTEHDKQVREAAWQPIETAPKGEQVLLWAPGWSCEIGIWIRAGTLVKQEGWHHWEGSRKFTSEPTHWRPIPDPPAPERKP